MTLNSLHDENQYVALIVEDEMMEKSIMAMNLSALGIRSIDASTLVGAFEVLKNITPDVIFLDVELHFESGFDFLEKRRHDEDLKKLRVIVTTGYTDKGTIKKALDLGANGYLSKPLEKKLLVAELQKLGMKIDQEKLTNPLQDLDKK